MDGRRGMHRAVVVVAVTLALAALSCGPPGLLPSPTSTPAPTPTETPVPATPTPTPPPRAATLRSASGAVEARALGGDFAPAAPGQALAPGDEIRTGADGEAILELDDGTVIRVAPESQIQVALLEGTPQQPVTRFFLHLGQVFSIREEALPPGGRYEVETLTGVAGIRGSYLGVKNRLDLGAEVTCLIGSCFAQAAGQVVDLAERQTTSISPQGVVAAPEPMTPDQEDEWSETFERLDAAGVEVEDVSRDGDGDGDEPDDSGQPTGDTGDTGDGDSRDCHCEGPDLVCADGSSIPNDPTCTQSTPGPGVDPFGGICSCVGADLVCTVEGESISYPSHPFCGGTQGDCFCANNTLFCADGTFVEGGC